MVLLTTHSTHRQSVTPADTSMLFTVVRLGGQELTVLCADVHMTLGTRNELKMSELELHYSIIYLVT